MSYIRATKSDYAWSTREIPSNGTIPTVNTSQISYSGTKIGSNVPHWRTLIKKGSDATSGYTRDDYQLEVKAGSASWAGRSRPTPPTVPTSYRGSFSGTALNPSSGLTHLTTSLSKANAAALKEVYSKLSQEHSHLNGLQTLGELGETIRMLRHPFKAIADLTHRHITRLVKSKRGLRGKESVRQERYYELVRTSYLEYVFGLAPLISETKGYAETIARWQLESEGIKYHRKKIVGRGEDVVAIQAVTPGVQFGLNSNYYFTRVTRTTTTRRVQYVCGLNSTLTAPAGSTDRLIELCGFNLRGFIPTIWELIPWTWLADYVANVNDIVEASVANTSNVAWVSKTVCEITEQDTSTTCDSARMRQRLDSLGLEGGGGGFMGRLILRRTSMTRTVGETLGIPAFTFTLPVDAKQYANAFAAVFALRAPSAFRLRNPY